MLFLGYVGIMLFLLFVENREITQDMPYWAQVEKNCNFKLFHTIRNYWDVLTRPEYYVEKWDAYAVYRLQACIAAVNLLGNVIMFVPMGLFLPMMWKKLHHLWRTVFVSLLVIVSVESVQLLSLRGRCDVDDFVLNMIGVFLGYGIWRLSRFLTEKRK